jgi:hypothetical protein
MAWAMVWPAWRPAAMRVTGVETERITVGDTELLPLLERVVTEL